MKSTGGYTLPPSLLRCLDYRAEKLFTYRPSEKHARLAEKYRVLPYMVYRYEDMLGSLDEVEELLALKASDILRGIRVNTLRVTVDTLKELLEAKGFVLRRYWIDYALVVEHEPFSIGATHEYMEGLYYIQGLGSQVPVYITNPHPGMHTIDLAAAPGGKTTQIAQHLGGSGVVVAIDVSRRRLRALKNHVNRMGFTNIIVLALDAREAPRVIGGNRFDYVLLDAPCTGEGLLPLDERRRASRTPLDLADRACLQKQMLKAAVRLAKPGSTIVYTTCSIAPEENEYVVSMIAEEEDVEIIEPPLKPPVYSQGITSFNNVDFDERVSRCIRLYPHQTRTEGFTICVLRKRR